MPGGNIDGLAFDLTLAADREAWPPALSGAYFDGRLRAPAQRSHAYFARFRRTSTRSRRALALASSQAFTMQRTPRFRAALAGCLKRFAASRCLPRAEPPHGMIPPPSRYFPSPDYIARGLSRERRHGRDSARGADHSRQCSTRGAETIAFLDAALLRFRLHRLQEHFRAQPAGQRVARQRCRPGSHAGSDIIRFPENSRTVAYRSSAERKPRGWHDDGARRRARAGRFAMVSRAILFYGRARRAMRDAPRGAG